jgi:hypothetical protein
LTHQELEQRWGDLAGGSGPRVVQAIWDLAARPEQAIPLLRRRIARAVRPDTERVARLVRDLDSEEFGTRTQASAELEGMAEGAEPALRKALAETPSPEVRRRIEAVLQKPEVSQPAESLRAQRAVQVLEYAATREAREFLGVLAQGAEHAPLTQAARAALQRLSKEPGR